MTSSIKNSNKTINWRDLSINKRYKIINISDAIKNKYGVSHILTLSDEDEKIIKVWSSSSLLEYLNSLLGKIFVC